MDLILFVWCSHSSSLWKHKICNVNPPAFFFPSSSLCQISPSAVRQETLNVIYVNSLMPPTPAAGFLQQTELRFKVKKPPSSAEWAFLESLWPGWNHFAAPAINKSPSPALASTGWENVGISRGMEQKCGVTAAAVHSLHRIQKTPFHTKILLTQGEKLTSDMQGSDRNSTQG